MHVELTEANLATIGRFAEELEVQAHPNTSPIPPLSSLPPLTTTHSQASTSSITTLARHGHTTSMISTKELESALDAQRAANPYLVPTAANKLKKSFSLNGIDNPNNKFYAFEASKDGEENTISISLADFDELDLETDEVEEIATSGPSRQSSTVFDKENRNIDSKSFSGLSLKSANHTLGGINCPSYSSLMATVDTIEPPPVSSQKEQPRKIDPLQSLKSTDNENTLLSSSLPVTSTESTNRFRNPLVRKKFVIQPQHISSYSAPKSEKLTYTSELPDMFKLDLKSSLADSYSAKVRRMVNDHPPPHLPAHLESSFINSSAKASKDETKGWKLPVPSHVVLNHLATASVKHEMLAVASTSRYRDKYSKLPSFFFCALQVLILTTLAVTQILYEPI